MHTKCAREFRGTQSYFLLEKKTVDPDFYISTKKIIGPRYDATKIIAGRGAPRVSRSGKRAKRETRNAKQNIGSHKKANKLIFNLQKNMGQHRFLQCRRQPGFERWTLAIPAEWANRSAMSSCKNYSTTRK